MKVTSIIYVLFRSALDPCAVACSCFRTSWEAGPVPFVIGSLTAVLLHQGRGLPKMTGRKTAVSRQMQAGAVQKAAKNPWRHTHFKSLYKGIQLLLCSLHSTIYMYYMYKRIETYQALYKCNFYYQYMIF